MEASATRGNFWMEWTDSQNVESTIDISYDVVDEIAQFRVPRSQCRGPSIRLDRDPGRNSTLTLIRSYEDPARPFMNGGSLFQFELSVRNHIAHIRTFVKGLGKGGGKGHGGKGGSGGAPGEDDDDDDSSSGGSYGRAHSRGRAQGRAVVGLPKGAAKAKAKAKAKSKANAKSKAKAKAKAASKARSS
jgi:hypothetical protein